MSTLTAALRVDLRGSGGSSDVAGLGKRLALLASLCISGFREQVPMDAGTQGPTDGDNL